MIDRASITTSVRGSDKVCFVFVARGCMSVSDGDDEAAGVQQIDGSMLAFRHFGSGRPHFGHRSLRSFSSTSKALMINVKDLSPPIHRIQAGARILDRDVFHRTIPVHAARIPARNTGTFVKGLRK